MVPTALSLSLSLSLTLALTVALSLALSLSGCGTTDPALKRAIQNVADRPELARVQLRPFAEQGNPTAIAQICIAYGRSIGNRVQGAERAQAFAWCHQAAQDPDTDGPHIDSLYHLGLFYKSGIGTAEDRVAALQWFKKAASLGHKEAKNEARGLEGKPRLCTNFITNCRMF